MSRPDDSAIGRGVTDWYQSLGYRELDMDSYPPPSPVYRPGSESDPEEDTETPVYRSPTPPAARPRIEQGVMHDLQGQRMDSLANQLGYQKELISILEKEMLEHRTEAARAEARSTTRVTIAVLILVIIFFLVGNYQRR
ncbi:hypothetical protein L1987_08997 [Smallanthus sonchifolius]|uniref:Uncharacterized protein n=1 Tax=Smallanthus sonchifolius TaxID=185202 RepID=A0ACB9JM71_9ASTR|nr:hypothetical protein L1987_08997 [Smallanthus sonchifolius]